MTSKPVNFRLWLCDELVADASGDAVPGGSRNVVLSDLALLARLE